jgi:hypothetical protein
MSGMFLTFAAHFRLPGYLLSSSWRICSVDMLLERVGMLYRHVLPPGCERIDYGIPEMTSSALAGEYRRSIVEMHMNVHASPQVMG